MERRREWFAPKRFGLGASLPIAWQGWALTALLIAAIALALWLFGDDGPGALAIIIPAIIGFTIIVARTTRGGWRWRWGEKE